MARNGETGHGQNQYFVRQDTIVCSSHEHLKVADKQRNKLCLNHTTHLVNALLQEF